MEGVESDKSGEECPSLSLREDGQSENGDAKEEVEEVCDGEGDEEAGEGEMPADLLAAAAVVRLARDQRHPLVHRQTHDREDVAEASCGGKERESWGNLR